MAVSLWQTRLASHHDVPGVIVLPDIITRTVDLRLGFCFSVEIWA